MSRPVRFGSEEVGGLAYRLAAQAFERANILPSLQQHMDDAKQEALLGLWLASQKPANYQMAYACVAGRNRVLAWIFKFLLEDRSARPGAWQATGRVDILQLHESYGDATADPEALVLALEEEQDRQSLLVQVEQVLVNLFIEARQKGGERTRTAAARDARIVTLSLQGFSPAGIAQEMGISEQNARSYLRMARRVISVRLQE